MDGFMDKLAQKFTAQEMIKANGAADAEQMKLLKAQVEEYGACLNRMKELGEQLDKTAASAQERINSAKVDNSRINEDVTRLVDQGVAKIQEIQADMTCLEDLREKLEEIQKGDVVTDFMHKECVKVYRNVQAVVQEESGKQKEETDKGVKALRKKMNVVLSVAVISLIVSLAGIVFQVLQWLNII